MTQNINLLEELPVQQVSAFNGKIMLQIFVGWILILILIYTITFGIQSSKRQTLVSLETSEKKLLSKIKELAPLQEEPYLENTPTNSGSLLGFYRYFEDLTALTPHGVWLNTIKIFEKDGSIITIKGSAVAASGVSALLESLNGSNSFRNKKFSAIQLEKNPQSDNTDFVISTVDSIPTTNTKQEKKKSEYDRDFNISADTNPITMNRKE